LGRYPEPIEVSFYEVVLDKTRSYSRAIRLLKTHFDQTILQSASSQRANDTLLYLASQQFEKRPSYRSLEAKLQRDIKYFFGDYKSAMSAGLRD
jgi:hypothetical protein